jgi:hypothetical protein
MNKNETLNNIVGGGTAENSAVPEIVISPEDRERLDNLFERIGDTGLDCCYSEYERKLKAELQREGILAGRYLLEKIQQEENSHSVFKHICSLKICATPEISPAVGALLLEDKIAGNHDGSSLHNLLEILEDIGTSPEAHFLVQSIYKTAVGRSGLVDYDTSCVFDALRKILERTEDKAVVREAMDEINVFRKEHGFDELTETPSYSFGAHIPNYRPAPEIDISFDSIREEDDDDFDNYFGEHESDSFSDNEIDERFCDEYYEKNKMLSAVGRLEIVKNLRIEAQKEKDPDTDPEEPDDFLRKHFLEYKEKNPSSYGVTLGIEIEIPEKTVLPKELVKNYSYDDEVYAERNKYYKKFREAEKIGVPNGGDLFWEFAHQPARNPLTISREVQALVGMGLINKKYAKYPLHVTLGGITSNSDDTGYQAHVLSHALEATGWSTNANRLTRPYKTRYGSWTQKGDAGIRERVEGWNEVKTDKDLGIRDVGVEFRTLQFQSLSGLDRHLHSAYYLGTALRAYQDRKQSKQDTDLVRAELADIWMEFSEKCSRLFTDIGLDVPSQKWRINCDYSNEQSSFKDLAKILGEGTTNKESKSAKFIHDMRLLIIQTRTKVKEVLEKEKPMPKE